MATNFPASVDDGTTLPNPTATSKTNNPSLSSGQSNQNDAIKAIETKVGTGSSTPASNTLLRGTGAGTSSWSSLTSSQLAASISDETGTGSAVFATTPTLVTPKVDTINESTSSNGTTIGGVNIKSGALNTSNSVVTANITDNAVTASKLATNAITLGYTPITSNFTLSSSQTTPTQVTGLSVTVTIPAGGRRIRITAFTSSLSPAAGVAVMTIWDGVVNSGTLMSQANSSSNNGAVAVAIATPSAGSKTYNVGLNNSGANNATVGAAATAPAFILVEAI